MIHTLFGYSAVNSCHSASASLAQFARRQRRALESAFNLKDELELPAPYSRFMTVGLGYARDLHSVLEIGFGGGRTAWYLHRTLPGIQVVSVELDPVVVDLARKYFGVADEPNFKVVNEDGRQFLAHSDERSPQACPCRRGSR